MSQTSHSYLVHPHIFDLRKVDRAACISVVIFCSIKNSVYIIAGVLHFDNDFLFNLMPLTSYSVEWIFYIVNDFFFSCSSSLYAPFLMVGESLPKWLLYYLVDFCLFNISCYVLSIFSCGLDHKINFSMPLQEEN